jgi:hypothetical protein
LAAAKRQAIARFLPAPGTSTRRVVHQVSAHPQRNVVGVGVGAKIVKGKTTDRPSVRLYVARKLSKGLLSPALTLPAEIDGVDTDVVELGRLQAQGLSARLRKRPAKPGCSIGFALAGAHADLLMAGTFGAVVSRDGSMFILSNNHVLACENELPIGTPIFNRDCSTMEIRAWTRSPSFPFHYTARVAAQRGGLCHCGDPESGADTGDIDGEGRQARELETIDATERMAVKKIGRGSGYTIGEVFDVSATVTLTTSWAASLSSTRF